MFVSWTRRKNDQQTLRGDLIIESAGEGRLVFDPARRSAGHPRPAAASVSATNGTSKCSRSRFVARLLLRTIIVSARDDRLAVRPIEFVKLGVAVAVGVEKKGQAVRLAAEAVADVQTVGQAQAARFRRAKERKKDGQLDRARGMKNALGLKGKMQVRSVVVQCHGQRGCLGLPAEVEHLFEQWEAGRPAGFSHGKRAVAG